MDTPAYLPSLGLLDGLGAAAAGGADSPAALPHIGLLQGASPVSAPFVDERFPQLPPPLPRAWLSDIGVNALYGRGTLGLLVANRDEVFPGVNQGGDPAPLPHMGLLLAAGSTPPTLVVTLKAGSWIRYRKLV